MDELRERLEEVKAVSDDVRVKENGKKWAVSINFDNYDTVSRQFKRSYEPAGIILEVLKNSQIEEVFMTGGSEMDYHFCIVGDRESEYRAFAECDFEAHYIRKSETVSDKQIVAGAKLKIPKHGIIRVGFGPAPLSWICIAD